MLILRKFFIILFTKLKDSRHNGNLKHLFINHPLNKVSIIFSRIPADRKYVYNYTKSLKDFKVDKLFLLDNFGYGCLYI